MFLHFMPTITIPHHFFTLCQDYPSFFITFSTHDELIHSNSVKSYCAKLSDCIGQYRQKQGMEVGDITYSEKVLGRLRGNLPRGSVVIKEEKVLGHCADSDSKSFHIEQVCVIVMSNNNHFFNDFACIST